MDNLTPFQKAVEFYKSSKNPNVETRIFLTSILGLQEQLIDAAITEIEFELASPFKKIATRAAARGEKRVLPIQIGGKNPLVSWAQLPIHNASTEEWERQYQTWIDDIDARFPDANGCVVANKDEFLFVDEDLSQEFRQGYEAFAGEPFPETYTTSARENRCQSHWLQTDATRQLGNVAQGATQGQMISVRQHQLYVLAEGSLHKNGADIYKVVVDAPIIPMPDKLVEYIQSIRTDKNVQTGDFSKKPEDWLDAPFIHGNINNQIVEFVGHYIAAKNINDPEELFLLIKNKIEQNGCFEPDGVTPYLWKEDEVKAICRDKVSKWKTGEQEANEAVDQALAEGQKIALRAKEIALTQPNAHVVVQQVPEIDTSEGYTRPVFPYWAISGTSIWDGLVAPALKTSSKHAEFIYMPAAQMVMNFLSGQVTIKMHNIRFNLFLGLVSPYGEFFKSSSCMLAHEYCKRMEICTTLTKSVTSNGRVLVGQAGSPEGFGLAVTKANGRHAVLFNDELGKFASKAGIESSSFADDLLTWYGAGEFGNNVTTQKNNFHFEGGTYTFGWLWCTTDRGFNRHWPKLAGIVSGLEDRMFFIVSPEKPKQTVPFQDPILLGAVETRKRVDAAIQKKEYEFEDPAYFTSRVAGMDPRSMELVMNLALFLTIDLGRDVIDDDIIERSLALVEYRNRASAFLEPIEADNQQGRLQKEILRELKQHRGKMSYRQLCRSLDFERYGLDVWNRAYRTMLPYGNDEGVIYEWPEQTTPGKRATRMVGIIKYDDSQTDENRESN